MGRHGRREEEKEEGKEEEQEEEMATEGDARKVKKGPNPRNN